MEEFARNEKVGKEMSLKKVKVREKTERGRWENYSASGFLCVSQNGGKMGRV